MIRPKALVVEDESAQAEVLRYNLEADGYEIHVAHDGEEALLLLEEVHPDIVLLDWMLPKLSGIEVCRRLRARPARNQPPVVIISARSDEFDKVKALETGADDFITKPYSVIELLARLRVQLRRTRPSAVGETLEFDDIRVDTLEHRAFRAGRPLRLGPTEYRLLLTLIERPGRVFSREQLLDRVWGRDSYIDTRTVDVHIGRLRKSLAVAPGADPIRTVRGAGYALG